MTTLFVVIMGSVLIGNTLGTAVGFGVFLVSMAVILEGKTKAPIS